MAKPVWVEHNRYARSIRRASKARRQAMIRKLLERCVKTLFTPLSVDPLPGPSPRGVKIRERQTRSFWRKQSE